MKQSLRLLQPPGMPHFGDEFYPDDRHYIWSTKGHPSPPDRQKALRAFHSLGDALKWGKTNLGADNFCIAQQLKGDRS